MTKVILPFVCGRPYSWSAKAARGKVGRRLKTPYIAPSDGTGPPEVVAYAGLDEVRRSRTRPLRLHRGPAVLTAGVCRWELARAGPQDARRGDPVPRVGSSSSPGAAP